MSWRDSLNDILHERTNYDFIGRKRQWFAASLVVIAIGLISLGTRGFHLGIEFKGGTAWDVPVATRHSVSVGGVRDALRPLGLAEASVTIARDRATGGRLIRVQGPHVGTDKEQQVTRVLAKEGGSDERRTSVNSVGPTWGHDVSQKAVRALVYFFIAIVIYLSWRFEPKMAAAAVAAVVHDILVTVGIYSLSGFTVTPATVIAFLTILGFSLYDTVVVFDKVSENVQGLATTGRETYSDVVNRSMNQVLMRSLNTSFVALIPVFSLLVVGAYIFGATTIKDFSLALFIGLLTGAYSSIFTASPILAWWKEREPRYAALRSRIAARAAAATPTLAGTTAGGSTSPSVGTEGDGEGSPVEAARPSPRVATATRPGAPRPRKKKRRR
jgi:preprotein translocase subunit SecF